jgi:CheY-like chemotaxis protein
MSESIEKSGAFRQFHAHHPDVTLMDLPMSEMNGLDAVSAIGGDFPTRESPRARSWTHTGQPRTAGMSFHAS